MPVEETDGLVLTDDFADVWVVEAEVLSALEVVCDEAIVSDVDFDELVSKDDVEVAA